RQQTPVREAPYGANFDAEGAGNVSRSRNTASSGTRMTRVPAMRTIRIRPVAIQWRTVRSASPVRSTTSRTLGCRIALFSGFMLRDAKAPRGTVHLSYLLLEKREIAAVKAAEN